MNLPLALGRPGNDAKLPFLQSRVELRQRIDALPAGNPHEALVCSVEQLDAINHSRVGWRLKFDLAELLREHIEALLPAVERDLTEATLPLLPRRRASARVAHEALAGLVCAYTSVLVSLTGKTFTFGLKQNLLPPLLQCLRALARRLALSHRIHAPHPKGVWQEMHYLFGLATRHGVVDASPSGTKQTPSGVYRDALLFAFAEPSTLMQGDVERLIPYLARFGERAEFGRREQEAAGPGVFVIRPERDAPGYAAGKSHPQTAAHTDLVLKCRRLVQTAREQSEGLDIGVPPAELGLPDSPAGPVSRDLLLRLVQHWGNATMRQFKRLHPRLRVELAVGLRAIWNSLVGGPSAVVPREGRSGWIIANESPDGFALLNVSGGFAPIRVGEVVGVQTQGACRVCVVRWMRSENPDHLDLGLQALAPNAIPVTVGENEEPIGVPALLLPEIPALRKAATILAPFGRMNPERDYRIDHRGLRWRVRTVKLLEQTPSVQIFRFNPGGRPKG